MFSEKLKYTNSYILTSIAKTYEYFGFDSMKRRTDLEHIDLNTQDENGKTLLMYNYIFNHHKSNIDIFFNYFQPDVTIQDNTGRTAADYARENGFYIDSLRLYEQEIEASTFDPSKKQELQSQLKKYYIPYVYNKRKIKKLKNILQQFRTIPEDSFKAEIQESDKTIIQRGLQEQLVNALQHQGNTLILRNLANSGCDFSKVNLNLDTYKSLSKENKEIIQERRQKQLEEALQGSGDKQILQNLVESEFDFSRVNLNLYSYKSLSKNNRQIVQRGKQKQLKKALQGNGDKEKLQILAYFGCDFSKINLNSELYENLSKENKIIIRRRQQEQLTEALHAHGDKQILQNLANAEYDFSKINLNSTSCKYLSEDNKKIIQQKQQAQSKEKSKSQKNVQITQNVSGIINDLSKINLNSDLYKNVPEYIKKNVQERQYEQLQEALQGSGDKQILQNLANAEYDFSKINLKSDSYVHLSEDNKEIIRRRQQEQLTEALQKSGNAYILQNLSNSGCDFSGINLNSDLYVHLSKDNKDIVQKRQEKQLEEALRGNGDKQILQNLANAEYDFSKINLNSTSCKYLSEDNKKIIQQKQQAQSKEKSKSQKNVQITQNVSGIINDLSKINLNSDLYKNVPEYIKKNVQERQYEQLQEALQGSGDKQILQNLANAEYDFSKINLKSDSYVHLSEDNKEIIRKRQEKQLIKALQKPENIPILQNLADSEVNFGIISLYLRTDLSSTAKQIIQERQEKQAMEREQNTQQAAMQSIWRRNLGVCGTSSANQSQNTHLGQNHTIPGAQQPPAVRGAGNQGNQRGNVNNMGG